jgi:adenylate cyclase
MDAWIKQAWLYIPQDRRAAIVAGRDLPENVQGAALFADISGFTPLTEALTESLGLRRGAEELPLYLNAIYDALIREVERFGGSVIGFAGDAITCWFDESGSGAFIAAQAAVSCALAMQTAMQSFTSVAVPGREPVALAVKVAVACGPARRFLVGDPGCLRYDVLAGETLYRMAEAEHHAQRGEILLDEATVARLGDSLEIRAWRTEQADGGPRFAVLAGQKTRASENPWPELQAGQLTEEQVRPWVHPAVVERLQAGMGEFLTELRPTVAIFLKFNGIDYDRDPQAGQRLNEYICAVQALLSRGGGNLLEITVGDKGSYLYISFGATVSHEDDAHRAVLAALQLSKLTSGLAEGTKGAEIQIGVTRGTMRTGEYGGKTRRSYGALGDDVNLAARLMGRAAPGEVLVSRRVHKELTAVSATGTGFQTQGLIFAPREPIQLKGKAEPIPVFAVTGIQQHRAIRLQEPSYALPMVGREVELAAIAARIELVLQGQGQVVGITADPGMGKSRLVAEAIRLGRAKGLEGFGGACQSDGTQTPYLVWKPIRRPTPPPDPQPGG